MNIGVIEIMPQGHYTLVESVAKIFASDSANHVSIYTTKIGYHNTFTLLKSYKNIEVINIEEKGDVISFINHIDTLQLDRAYIITLDHYLKEFSKIEFKFPIHLFIHNIYLWFDLSLKSNIIRTWNEFLTNPKILHYWIKRNFIQSNIKKRLAKKILISGGKYVVLNSNLSNELQKFVPRNTIEEIPFSIYQSSIADKSNTTLLRVCIPGMLSAVRRDYFSVFKLMESEAELFKSTILIDLLGGVNVSENGDKVLMEARRLEQAGFNIKYYNKPLVELEEFDVELSKANIVLGNMHVVMNALNIYGKSKDSGMMYTMIKAAKPGLLPSGYSILPELASSTLIFSNYEALKNILIDLIKNKDKLILLMENAKTNAEHFSPELVYKRIIKN